MNHTKQPNKAGEHLFSPHTDRCIYCGESASDDCVENSPCESDLPAPCEKCNGKGWSMFNAGTKESPRYEIQKCEVCQQYPGDLAAWEAVEKAALAHPALRKFVEKIAKLKHEGEPDEDGPFERASEDSIASLNQIILEARELLGTADKCDKCGQVVA